MNSSITKLECPVCSKKLSSKYTLGSHMKTFHANSNGVENVDMDCDTFGCSSVRCEYTTKHKSDLKKHQERCMFLLVDIELERQASLLREKFQTDCDAIRVEYESTLSALREENSALRAERNLLQSMMDKSEDRVHRLTERVIDKPVVINQYHNEIGQLNQQHHNNVKVTNYLTDYKTFETRTHPDFVTQVARQNMIQYFMDGQGGLARFVVECIIRCEKGGMILCCTDTARKRFRFLNANGELQEDLEARMLTSKLSIPIKQVAHEVFQHICTSLEKERQVKISEKAGTFEVGFVEKKIEMAHDHLFSIREFDLEDKNSEFLTELCGLLRGPLASLPSSTEDQNSDAEPS